MRWDQVNFIVTRGTTKIKLPQAYFFCIFQSNERGTREVRVPRQEWSAKKKERKKELYDFELLLSRVIRASRSLNTRLRSPVKRKKLCWYCRPLRHKLSVKSDVLRWSVKHEWGIRGNEKLVKVTRTIEVSIKFFFFLFQRGGVLG